MGIIGKILIEKYINWRNKFNFYPDLRPRFIHFRSQGYSSFCSRPQVLQHIKNLKIFTENHLPVTLGPPQLPFVISHWKKDWGCEREFVCLRISLVGRISQFTNSQTLLSRLQMGGHMLFQECSAIQSKSHFPLHRYFADCSPILGQAVFPWRPFHYKWDKLT